MRKILLLKRMLVTNKRHLFVAAILLIALIYTASAYANQNLKILYTKQISPIVKDRNGEEILIQPNIKGHYMRPGRVPERFRDILVKKEDRLFYYHLGINPWSVARSMFGYVFASRFAGSSTITQQLVKNILGNENERTLSNKIIESLYAVALELQSSKNEIVNMYTDTAYFGKQAEGLLEASRSYFNVDPEALTDAQILQLLATLSYPVDTPGTIRNNQRVLILADRFQIPINDAVLQDVQPDNSVNDEYERKSPSVFELSSLMRCEPSSTAFQPRHQGYNPSGKKIRSSTGSHPWLPVGLGEAGCNITIDNNLTNTLREVLQKNLASPAFESVRNGAVVVLRIDKEKPLNEILALVGSPYPHSTKSGYQINMAVRPRPIGSTWKPFIYAEAFAKDVRPYTIIEDVEYKYEIGTGFAFYPKNYDGIYRGEVTAHYALSNSLNVPAVRVLQYVGLENFANFLTEKLTFRPHQPIEQYQLSIALGGLEMDLLTLANYFSVFPNNGILKPLAAGDGQYPELPMSTQPNAPVHVIDQKYTALVTKILSDRSTGIEQFGLRSNLNVPFSNYAVKTGTTYDYHDSWTIGYTPDFVVGVWIGNSDNTPMQRLSGSTGAGKIWHDVMTILLNSQYNTGKSFDFGLIKEYRSADSLEYGLEGDDYDLSRNLLKNSNLVLQPHHGDTLLYENKITVPLVASESVAWYINGNFIGNGNRASWNPPSPGVYTIRAKTINQKQQTIKVNIVEEKRY